MIYGIDYITKPELEKLEYSNDFLIKILNNEFNGAEVYCHFIQMKKGKDYGNGFVECLTIYQYEAIEHSYDFYDKKGKLQPLIIKISSDVNQILSNKMTERIRQLEETEKEKTCN